MKPKKNHKTIRPNSSTICRAKAQAYYSSASFSDGLMSKRLIEDALLANSATPQISKYGIEPMSAIDGWWYTGVDEESMDQLLCSITPTH